MPNIGGLTSEAEPGRVDPPAGEPGGGGQPAAGQPEHRAPPAARGQGAHREGEGASSWQGQHEISINVYSTSFPANF